MNKFIGITALVSGSLLIIVPRFILPACEYQGFSPMHCSQTAHAEWVAGGLFMAVGIAVLLVRAPLVVMGGAALGLAIDIASFVLPDIFGYCRSSRMPCNYGMVPGVRFIGIVSGSIMVLGFVIAIRMHLKKGTPRPY